MKRTKRIWALMLTLLMTLCLLNGAAFAEGEEYYWHSKSTEEKHQNLLPAQCPQDMRGRLHTRDIQHSGRRG